MPTLNAVAESAAAAGAVAEAAAEATLELSARMRDVEQLVAMRPPQPVARSRDELAAAIAEHPAVARFAAAVAADGKPDPVRFAVPLRNDLSHLTVPVAPQVVPGFVNRAQRPLRVADLLPKHPTTKNAIVFLRETAETNNAAPVSELATKPQTALVYEEIEAPTVTFAHFMRAAKQILSDSPELQKQIANRLLYGLRELEERQILNGSGVGENLEGLRIAASEAELQNAIGTPTASWRGVTITAPTRVDVLRCAIADVELGSGLLADGLVMNPVDIAAIELGKLGNEEYTVQAANGEGDRGPGVKASVTSLWGLPVVPSIEVPAGSFLVGSFAHGAAIYQRDEVTIELGYAENDFTQNAIRILCEERAAMPIWQSSCFIKGEF